MTSKVEINNKIKFWLLIFFAWFLFATYVVGKNIGVLLYLTDSILELKNILLGVPLVIMGVITLERYFNKKREAAKEIVVSICGWICLTVLSLITFVLLKKTPEVFFTMLLFYAPCVYFFYITIGVIDEIKNDEKKLAKLLKEKEGVVNE